MTTPQQRRHRFEIEWGCLPIIAMIILVWAGIAAACLAVTR